MMFPGGGSSGSINNYQGRPGGLLQTIRAKSAANNAPPPPATALDPEIAKARAALLKSQLSRMSTILTTPSGVLGDPPLNRPTAGSPGSYLG